MIRILLHYVLPLVLPLLLYIVYMSWMRRRALAAGGAAPDWREGPIFWFVLGGLLLAVASLVALFAFEGDDGMGNIYQPPRVEGGKVVPGQFSRPGAAGD
ncbi:MAG: DUF6111 family protein [Alphaproteobacteria bacterium]|nr:DUF6111 family protein [Alphaproteobacteria bacterium]